MNARALRMVLCAGVVLSSLPACRDRGRDRYREARAEYERLIERHTPLRDPAFDQVREKLLSVPKDSKARPEAERLANAIANARVLPPAPLATAPQPGADGGALDAACAALAQQLGRADAGERPRYLEALRRCREQQERERAGTHPEPEPEP